MLQNLPVGETSNIDGQPLEGLRLLARLIARAHQAQGQAAPDIDEEQDQSADTEVPLSDQDHGPSDDQPGGRNRPERGGDRSG